MIEKKDDISDTKENTESTTIESIYELSTLAIFKDNICNSIVKSIFV